MAALALAGAGQLRAGTYDDQTIPGKWLKQLLPEKAEEPHYADYDKDSALAKALRHAGRKLAADFGRSRYRPSHRAARSRPRRRDGPRDTGVAR